MRDDKWLIELEKVLATPSSCVEHYGLMPNCEGNTCAECWCLALIEVVKYHKKD